MSAGSYRSPTILLLSGVGPAKELSKLGIDIKSNLPGVGKNLHDHAYSIINVAQKPGTNERSSFYSDPENVRRAREQWIKDQTGPLSVFMSTMALGFLKIDNISKFDEYKNLEPSVREYLSNETVPTWELVSVRFSIQWLFTFFKIRVNIRQDRAIKSPITAVKLKPSWANIML